MATLCLVWDPRAARSLSLLQSRLKTKGDRASAIRTPRLCADLLHAKRLSEAESLPKEKTFFYFIRFCFFELCLFVCFSFIICYFALLIFFIIDFDVFSLWNTPYFILRSAPWIHFINMLSSFSSLEVNISPPSVKLRLNSFTEMDSWTSWHALVFKQHIRFLIPSPLTLF